jgi:thymidylate synthase (FAD)
MTRVDLPQKQNVLDHGYVIVHDYLGSDLNTVNCARASFSKESKELSEKDTKLIQFLAKEQHYSPFRGNIVSLEFKAPLFVARQLFRYVVASTVVEANNVWNEASYRYISIPNEFYVPQEDQWRKAPDNKKQGSEGRLALSVSIDATTDMKTLVNTSLKLYDYYIEMGMAPEMARLFLPAYAMYVTWRATLSLETIVHLLKQRLDIHAQYETQLYAQALKNLVFPLFPISAEELFNNYR